MQQEHGDPYGESGGRDQNQQDGHFARLVGEPSLDEMCDVYHDVFLCFVVMRTSLSAAA